MALLSEDGRSGSGYLAVANGVSGTTTLYRVGAVPVAPALALPGIGLLATRRTRRT